MNSAGGNGPAYRRLKTVWNDEDNQPVRNVRENRDKVTTAAVMNRKERFAPNGKHKYLGGRSGR